MLSPEIARRFDRLFAIHEKGILTEDEFAEHLGYLITADNLEAVLERLPPNLLEAVKRGIRLDNQRAPGDECLRPEASLFQTTIISDYYRRVAAALLEPDLPKSQGLLSVICLPSFEVEWAMRLLGSEKKGYTLALSVAERQIWFSQANVPIAVRRLEAPLMAELGSLISEGWRKMLLRVRHPETGHMGLDGVTYHFACHGPGVGFMAGKTWSPDSTTAPGRLVTLSHLLYRYVEETDAVRHDLVGEILQSAAWFRDLV